MGDRPSQRSGALPPALTLAACLPLHPSAANQQVRQRRVLGVLGALARSRPTPGPLFLPCRLFNPPAQSKQSHLTMSGQQGEPPAEAAGRVGGGGGPAAHRRRLRLLLGG